MTGDCLVPSKRDIESVLAQAGTDKIAMFKVISIPNTVEARFLGEAVYIHRGKVYDFMGDREIVDLKAEDLLFMSYVKK